MRAYRTDAPQIEMWNEEEVMAHLSCDKPTAKRIMEECRIRHRIRGYGSIEKHLILDFINEKQRIEQERQARYNADIAATRQAAVLEEQVKALKEQTRALKEQTHTLWEQVNGLRIELASVADSHRDEITLLRERVASSKTESHSARRWALFAAVLAAAATLAAPLVPLIVSSLCQ